MKWTPIAIGVGIVSVVLIAFSRFAKAEEPTEYDEWGVPFAKGKGKLWPVVPFVHGIGTGPLAFHASREGGKRFHAGMDLYSAPGDTIVALDDGIFQNYAGGYVGLDAVVIQHGDINVLYGEFIAEKGFKHGDSISAGQKVGTTANSQGTSPGAVLSSMLHLETWDSSVFSGPVSTKFFTPWKSNSPMPDGLLDPTRFLQRTLEG